MVYTVVEKVMVVAIGGPVMAEGALDVMETFCFAGLCSDLGYRIFMSTTYESAAGGADSI
jgi:hypothetical protein